MTPSKEYRDKLNEILGFTKDERVVMGISQDRRNDGTVLGLGHTGREYFNIAKGRIEGAFHKANDVV